MTKTKTIKKSKLGDKIQVINYTWGKDIIENDQMYSDGETIYEYTLTAIKKVKVEIN